MKAELAGRRGVAVEALRRVAQALLVAASVRPALGFIVAAARGDRPGVFFSRRLGQPVCLRPRGDLQVAREFLSKDIYVPPPEVARALHARRRALTVLDLGANIGLFSLSAICTFGPQTRVRAVEPDPANLEFLRRNVELGRHAERVVVHACAAGTRSGRALLAAGLRHASHVVRTEKGANGTVPVAVRDAYELVPGCDLLKIDIEGSEWELLRDARLRSLEAAAIALEWHAVGSGVEAPEQEATRLLRAAGFTVGHQRAQANTGFLWAWREANPAPRDAASPV